MFTDTFVEEAVGTEALWQYPRKIHPDGFDDTVHQEMRRTGEQDEDHQAQRNSHGCVRHAGHALAEIDHQGEGVAQAQHREDGEGESEPGPFQVEQGHDSTVDLKHAHGHRSSEADGDGIDGKQIAHPSDASRPGLSTEYVYQRRAD